MEVCPLCLKTAGRTVWRSGEWGEVWRLEILSQIRTVCVCVCVCVSHSVMSDSLWPHGLQPARLLCPWNSPGKNTGAGCHFLLQCEFYFIFLLLLLFRILTLFLFIYFLLYNIGFAIHQTFSSRSIVTKLCLTPVTPQTVACQAPLSMGSSRQEHWSGLPFPSPKLELNSCIQRISLSPFSPFLSLFLSIINIIKEISFQNKI